MFVNFAQGCWGERTALAVPNNYRIGTCRCPNTSRACSRTLLSSMMRQEAAGVCTWISPPKHATLHVTT